MDDIEGKRVFGDRAGGAELLVAADIGVLSVAVAADRVGRFGVAHRCEPADVAAGGGRVAVATREDVLVRGADADEFATTGFGPAVAVGFDHGIPTASGPEGRIARWDDPGTREWTDLGRLDADVRAIDGRLIATADGIHRLPGLEYAGLDDVRDVAAAGPLAATGDGLYSLGNGWIDELEGRFRVAAAANGRAHAASTDGFYDRSEGGWQPVDPPVDGSVVDIAYADAVYAVTDGGDLLAEGESGWRAHPLGLSGVVGCAIGRLSDIENVGRG